MEVAGVMKKLAEAQRIVTPPGKRGKAPEKMGGYAFRTVDDVVASARDAFQKAGLLLHVETAGTNIVSSGILVDLCVRLIDLEDGSVLEQTVTGLSGQTSPQGIGIAHSYALKQALTQLLLIPAGPQADAEAHVWEPRARTERPVARAPRQEGGQAKRPWDGSRWQAEADQRGVTLELVHAELGIEIGSWAEAPTLEGDKRATLGRWLLEQA